MNVEAFVIIFSL